MAEGNNPHHTLHGTAGTLSLWNNIQFLSRTEGKFTPPTSPRAKRGPGCGPSQCQGGLLRLLIPPAWCAWLTTHCPRGTVLGWARGEGAQGGADVLTLHPPPQEAPRETRDPCTALLPREPPASLSRGGSPLLPKTGSILQVPLPVSWLLLSSAALSVCRSFSQGLCDCRTPRAEELCRSSPSRPRSRG